MQKRFILIEGDIQEKLHVTPYTEYELMDRLAPLIKELKEFIDTASIGEIAITQSSYYVVVRVQ